MCYLSIFKTKHKSSLHILDVPQERCPTYANTCKRENGWFMILTLMINIDRLGYCLNTYGWSGMFNCTNV